MVAKRIARVGGLVATGGETARALLTAAGLAGLRLGGEVETGVPWGLGFGTLARIGDRKRVLPIVTKAGAFGDADTLVRCRQALKQRAG
jgi:4-hydroxythreonine-4-phosphate dehydrogenase